MSLGTGLPIPVQWQMAQASSPAQQVQQSVIMGPASSNVGNSGSTFDASDFSSSPQVIPLNVTPEMIQPKRRGKVHNANSTGVAWGNLPGTSRGTRCNQGGASFLDQVKASISDNPWGSLWILLGLGVIVVAVADSQTTVKRNPGRRKKKAAKK